MTTPVFIAALALLIVIGAASDYANLRYPFFAGPLVLVLIACSVLLPINDLGINVRYMGCFLLIAGIFAAHATALVWLSNNFVGRKRRGLALGIVASIGNCGHLLGSNVFLDQEAPQYRTGFVVCLGLCILAVVLGTSQLGYFILMNRRSLASRDRAPQNVVEHQRDGVNTQHIY